MELDVDVAPTPFSFVTPSTRFGAGVSEDLPDVLDRFDVTRPLVVTDAGVRAAGILDGVTADIADPTVYDATTEPHVDDFGDLPDDGIDGVVAVGGGSCLDTAKVAAVLLAHGRNPTEYLGVDRVPGPIAPLLAVPTTSGTGSQATQTAVLHHEGLKRGISDECLRPDAALVDPTVTEGLPPDLTARSGFDAFVHAFESLTARDYRRVPPRPITYQGVNPVSRGLSTQALRLVHGALERATRDEQDARRAMSLGAHLAGVAFSNAGLGIIHALASTAGGLTGRPHGECLAAAVEPGLRYNLPVRREQYGRLASMLGLVDGPAADASTAANAFIEECGRLGETVGLPTSFQALGLDEGDLPRIVESTLGQDRRLATNPRDADPDDLRAVVAPALQ